MRFWETPVHIPNTMVKTKAADGTMLETAWESRWLPDTLVGTAKADLYILFKRTLKTSYRDKMKDKSELK